MQNYLNCESLQNVAALRVLKDDFGAAFSDCSISKSATLGHNRMLFDVQLSMAWIPSCSCEVASEIKISKSLFMQNFEATSDHGNRQGELHTR